MSPDNTLTLRNVQRHHKGNYTCAVRNTQGSDQIVYQLFVQVPPDPPELAIASTAATSVSIEWRAGNNGGAPLHGFILSYRRDFGEWSESLLDRHANSYQLDGLSCGTRYQMTLAAYNKIGTGTSSKVENTRTSGDKPVSPQRHHLIRSNVTSIVLELAAWQDGGCAIIYFTIEFRRNSGAATSAEGADWIVVSSSVAPQSRFTIPDLEPATVYNLRITAHNNAGATIAEYYFETLSLAGTSISANGGNDNDSEPVKSVFFDSNILLVSIVSVFSMCLAVIGACFCLYSRKF